MQKFVAAVAVLVFGFSVASADEFMASIKKVDGNKITVTKMKKGEKGEEVTLTVAKDAKVVKGKFNKETKKMEAGDAIEDGLKNEIFSKGGTFGSFITNDDGAVTEIRVMTGKKGKKE